MDTKRIELCVPSDRSMRLIVRMTTAGAMSRAGLTLDEVDDVKMAIDEACNLMILQKPECQSLRITYEYISNAIGICIEGLGMNGSAESTEDSNMQEVIRCILESMVDEVVMTPRIGGGTEKIYLRKAVPDRQVSAV